MEKMYFQLMYKCTSLKDNGMNLCVDWHWFSFKLEGKKLVWTCNFYYIDMNAGNSSLQCFFSHVGILLVRQFNKSRLLTPPTSDLQGCDLQVLLFFGIQYVMYEVVFIFPSAVYGVCSNYHAAGCQMHFPTIAFPAPESSNDKTARRFYPQNSWWLWNATGSSRWYYQTWCLGGKLFFHPEEILD